MSETKTLADKIFENKQLADTVNKPVLFDYNGVQVYIYPGESCQYIENKWQAENWMDATEHFV